MPAYLKTPGLKAYEVNIIGLSLKAHEFNHTLGDAFFEHYGTTLLNGGAFESRVILNKHETFIEVDFSIEGKADLICDRSLEPFQYPVRVKKQLLFKYGEEPGEVDENIIIITRDQATLELGQIMYELIALQIPMKKLHPRFQAVESESNDEGEIVYTSSSEKSDEETTDPRWEILKKLNKQ
ncbi:MAG: YceD family protein [Bacteroidota bacterium]